jgi:hypothetical protein
VCIDLFSDSLNLKRCLESPQKLLVLTILLLEGLDDLDVSYYRFINFMNLEELLIFE